MCVGCARRSPCLSLAAGAAREPRGACEEQKEAETRALQRSGVPRCCCSEPPRDPLRLCACAFAVPRWEMSASATAPAPAETGGGGGGGAAPAAGDKQRSSASSAPAVSVEGVDLLEKCGVCRERLRSERDPRLLPCLHTVCKECLKAEPAPGNNKDGQGEPGKGTCIVSSRHPPSAPFGRRRGGGVPLAAGAEGERGGGGASSVGGCASSRGDLGVQQQQKRELSCARFVRVNAAQKKWRKGGGGRHVQKGNGSLPPSISGGDGTGTLQQGSQVGRGAVRIVQKGEREAAGDGGSERARKAAAGGRARASWVPGWRRRRSEGGVATCIPTRGE